MGRLESVLGCMASIHIIEIGLVGFYLTEAVNAVVRWADIVRMVRVRVLATHGFICVVFYNCVREFFSRETDAHQVLHSLTQVLEFDLTDRAIFESKMSVKHLFSKESSKERLGNERSKEA